MVNPKFLAGLAVAARSAAVGAIATVVDLVALLALVSVVGVPVRAASIPALSVGIAVQFVGNKLFAFGDRSGRWLRQGAQFLSVEALGFVANLVLFDVLVQHVQAPYLLLRIVSTAAVYFGLCLPLWSRIFKAEPARSQ
jgi:putative flippase GtrA